jgi:Uma2 family endonuclease
MARAAGDGDHLLTLKQYEQLPEDDRYQEELVRGRLVREPKPATLHSLVQLRVGRLVDEFVERHGLGLTFVEAGFILSDDPPTVRAPDVSFVARDRAYGYPSDRLGRTPPDLAVEIVSPSNRASALQEKVLDYFDAHVRLVWVIDPSSRTVTVYRSPSDIRVLRDAEELDGGDVLPGFRLPLAALFTM